MLLGKQGRREPFAEQPDCSAHMVLQGGRGSPTVALHEELPAEFRFQLKFRAKYPPGYYTLGMRN